jgi:hypothetical protein
MRARKIKSQEQILRTIDNLRRDLYFSFGVASERLGLYLPQDDPRLRANFTSFQEYAWAIDVERALDALAVTFAGGGRVMPADWLAKAKLARSEESSAHRGEPKRRGTLLTPKAG